MRIELFSWKSRIRFLEKWGLYNKVKLRLSCSFFNRICLTDRIVSTIKGEPAIGYDCHFKDQTFVRVGGIEHRLILIQSEGFFVTEYKIIFEESQVISVAIGEQRRRRRRPSLAIPKLSRRINADYQPLALSNEQAELRRWRRGVACRIAAIPKCTLFTRTMFMSASSCVHRREAARSFMNITRR